MRFHHVGIAVRDIAKASLWWTGQNGFTAEGPVYHDPLQKVRVQFFVQAGGFRIELVEPAAEDSPVNRYLDVPGGMYHTCYEVDDLDATMAEWRSERAFPVTKPMPAVAFGGRRIVFLLTPDRHLVELVEATLAA